MIKIVGTDAASKNSVELALTDDKDRPTKLLLGLVALELALDCLVGYAAYRFFKR